MRIQRNGDLKMLIVVLPIIIPPISYSSLSRALTSKIFYASEQNFAITSTVTSAEWKLAKIRFIL